MIFDTKYSDNPPTPRSALHYNYTFLDRSAFINEINIGFIHNTDSPVTTNTAWEIEVTSRRCHKFIEVLQT